MTAATHAIWHAAGSPQPAQSVAALLTDTPSTCAMCGDHADHTADVHRALGSNFSDRSCFHRPDSTRVCQACLWCTSGRPPATLRMWTVIQGPHAPASHPKAFLQTRGLALINRAQAGAVADALIHPPPGPWVVSVATSGQKHVVPFATVNHGSDDYTVRYETVDIRTSAGEFAYAHAHTLALRRLGVPADAILTGQARLIRGREALRQWRHHTEHLAHLTRTPLLDLVLWTITKETIHAA